MTYPNNFYSEFIPEGTPPDVTPVQSQVMTCTIAIAVGCAAAYIILMVGLMLWCCQRRRRNRKMMKNPVINFVGWEATKRSSQLGRFRYPVSMVMTGKSYPVQRHVPMHHRQFIFFNRNKKCYERIRYESVGRSVHCRILLEVVTSPVFRNINATWYESLSFGVFLKNISVIVTRGVAMVTRFLLFFFLDYQSL